MPPTSSSIETGYGFNPHAKEFYPVASSPITPPPSLENMEGQMDPMSKATLPGYMGYAQGAQGHPGALPGHHQQLVHHGVAATHNPVMSNMEYVGLDTLGSSHSTPTSGVPAHLAGSAHNVHGMNMAPHLVQGAPSPYSAGNNGGGATVPAVAATPTSYPEVIQEVWKDTLEQAMEDMSSLVHNGYDRIGMDTEFPGVVAHATQAHKSKNGFSSHLWQTIRVNVNILKVIQIGMCFRDRNGDAPPDCPSTFQINFEFDLENDMYAMDSINLLKNSGIDFSQLKNHGCDVAKFAELLISSGLVLSDEITWVAFGSGYDFAYLIRLLTSQEVPADEAEFLELVSIYFPSFYDTKHMARECRLQHSGGLESLAICLNSPRVGKAHQAGSDSLVTVNVFFRLLQNYFLDGEEASLVPIKNSLHGFGPGASTPQRTYDD